MKNIGDIKLQQCTCGNYNLTINGFFSEKLNTKWVCCWVCNSTGPEEKNDEQAAVAWNNMQIDRRMFLTGSCQ